MVAMLAVGLAGCGGSSKQGASTATATSGAEDLAAEAAIRNELKLDGYTPGGVAAVPGGVQVVNVSSGNATIRPILPHNSVSVAQNDRAISSLCGVFLVIAPPGHPISRYTIQVGQTYLRCIGGGNYLRVSSPAAGPSSPVGG